MYWGYSALVFGSYPLHWRFVGLRGLLQSHQEPAIVVLGLNCTWLLFNVFPMYHSPFILISAIGCIMPDSGSVVNYAADETARASNLGRNKAFNQFDNVQTGSGAHTAPYSVSTSVHFRV